MTMEKEEQTFRGVVCLHCKAAIPVPAIVGSRQSSETDVEAMEARSQVFNLRCPSCHKEKPYRTKEIVTFEGTPQTVPTFESPAPMRWYSQDGLSRAAKA
jgi:hypothetical protein